MKSIWITCIFQIVFLFPVISQVFISDQLEDQIVLGPENVEGDQEVLAFHYLEKNQEYKELLLEKENENTFVINSYKEKKRLKKKDKRQMRRVEKENESIQKDLDWLNEINRQWEAYASHQEKLQEVYSLVKEGKCLEIETLGDVYAATDLVIEMEELEMDIDIEERIPVFIVEAKTEWVKKKADRNCLSADPNDCLVWCLVEVEAGYAFEDIEGKKHTAKNCPNGFYYQREMCQRSVEFETVSEETLSKITIKKDNEILELVDWRVIDCGK